MLKSHTRTHTHTHTNKVSVANTDGKTKSVAQKVKEEITA